MSEEETHFEQFINPYYNTVSTIIKSTGWYLVGIGIILIYTWPFINRKFCSWKKKRDEKEYDAKYHKNVDLSTELLIATQLSREKMQEKFSKERDIARVKEEERKEKKRQELLRLQNKTPSGYRLNGELSKANDQIASSSKSSKSKLHGDYNPLMGNGGGGRYTPSKRSCCGKGGCG